MVSDFKQLVVWQKAMELTNSIYSLVRNFLKFERYGLSSQITRAVVSISGNLAEGCGRQSNKEFVKFLCTKIMRIFGILKK